MLSDKHHLKSRSGRSIRDICGGGKKTQNDHAVTKDIHTVKPNRTIENVCIFYLIYASSVKNKNNSVRIVSREILMFD